VSGCEVAGRSSVWLGIALVGSRVPGALGLQGQVRRLEVGPSGDGQFNREHAVLTSSPIELLATHPATRSLWVRLMGRVPRSRSC
jgi:hypothetical protein